MKHPLDKVDELHTELKALLPLNAEVEQKLHKKFRLEFNYNSNHLEGNTLTYSETELLLIFDDTKGNHTLREYEEMKAHDVAYQTIEDWAKDPEHELTERDIRNLNQLILVRDFWKDAITPDGQSTRRKIKVGEYKEHPNSVRLQNGEMFHYTAPGDVLAAMQELMQWYRDERTGLHPLTLAAMFHYKFVCIHPFDDGNGRLARLLMNYVLLKNGYPPIVIKSKEKADYLRALNRADAGIFEDFISYISNQEIWSLGIYLRAANGESVEEKDDLEKEIELFKKSIDPKKLVPLQRTNENVLNVIRQSFLPFVDNLLPRINQFEDLFFNIEKRFVYNNLGGEFYDPVKRSGGFALSMVKYPEAFTTWSEKQLNSRSTVQQFALEMVLKGYKVLPEEDIRIYIPCIFQEYKVEIDCRLMHTSTVYGISEFRYNELIEETEIETSVKLVISKIMERLGKINGK